MQALELLVHKGLHFEKQGVAVLRRDEKAPRLLVSAHRVQEWRLLVAHRGNYEVVAVKAFQHGVAKGTRVRFHDPELVHNHNAACWDATKVVHGALEGFGKAGGALVGAGAYKVVLRVGAFARNAMDVYGFGTASAGRRLLLGEESVYRQGDALKKSPYKCRFSDAVVANDQNMHDDPSRLILS